MTTTINRAALRKAAAAAPGAKFDRQVQLGQRLYPDAYGRAVDSLVHRFVAHHADDPDLRTLARGDAPLLRGFLQKCGMSAEDAQVFTSGLLERDTFPRSPEAKKQLDALNYDRYRKECGGFEQAAPGIESNKRFWKEFRAEVPFYGERAIEQGADVDLPIVAIGAKYGSTAK